MTVEKWLKHGTDKLNRAGIGSARLDSLILLEDALHRDRAWLLANPEAEVSVTNLKKLERRLAKRAKHEPIAYIRGFTEFYGRKFKINRHVLEPRPESETMVEMALNLPLRTYAAIADIGTGCGAIGITFKLERPKTRVDLYDISAGALAVARANEHIHEIKLHVRKMDLLKRPLVPYDMLLANLPYVPSSWKINEAALAEPKIAIDGGQDGLDLYRRMFKQLNRFTWKPKYVLTESLPPQHPKLAGIAAKHGYKLTQTQDFIQVFVQT